MKKASKGAGLIIHLGNVRVITIIKHHFFYIQKLVSLETKQEVRCIMDTLAEHLPVACPHRLYSSYAWLLVATYQVSTLKSLFM